MHCPFRRQPGSHRPQERRPAIDRGEDRGANSLDQQRRVHGADKIVFAIVFEFDRQQVRPILSAPGWTRMKHCGFGLRTGIVSKLLFDASRPNESAGVPLDRTGRARSVVHHPPVLKVGLLMSWCPFELRKNSEGLLGRFCFSQSWMLFSASIDGQRARGAREWTSRRARNFAVGGAPSNRTRPCEVFD